MNQRSGNQDFLLHSLGETRSFADSWPSKSRRGPVTRRCASLQRLVQDGGDMKPFRGIPPATGFRKERLSQAHTRYAFNFKRLLDYVESGHYRASSRRRSSPVSIFTVVDLPAPFGPRNPKIVPGSIRMLRFSNAALPSYHFVRNLVSIISATVIRAIYLFRKYQHRIIAGEMK